MNPSQEQLATLAATLTTSASAVGWVVDPRAAVETAFRLWTAAGDALDAQETLDELRAWDAAPKPLPADDSFTFAKFLRLVVHRRIEEREKRFRDFLRHLCENRLAGHAPVEGESVDDAAGRLMGYYREKGFCRNDAEVLADSYREWWSVEEGEIRTKKAKTARAARAAKEAEAAKKEAEAAKKKQPGGK